MKFLTSDEHSNITPCALPEWLPGKIVHLMVVEFGRRLKVELHKLQISNELRLRRGTTDTVRMSMDSVRSDESEDRELPFIDDAFPVVNDSDSESVSEGKPGPSKL